MNATITALKTVWRHDLFALRWWLPLWITTLGLQKLTLWFGFVHFPSIVQYSISFTSLGLAGVWLLGLSKLLFNHVAADSTAAWRIRPLAPTAVALAKLTLGFVLLIALPAAWLSSVSITPPHFWPADTTHQFLRTVTIYGVAFLIFGFLASLCRTTNQFAVVLIILFVGAPAAAIWISTLVHHQIELLDPAVATSPFAAPAVVATALALTWRQYRTGQSLRHASIALSIGVALSLALPLLPDSSNTTTLPTNAFVQNVHSRGPQAVAFDYSFSALDSATAWQLSLQSTDASSTAVQPERATGEMLNTPSWRAQLGLADYEVLGLKPETGSDLINLPLDADPAHVRTTATFNPLHLITIATIPCVDGATFASDHVHGEVLRWSRPKDGYRVEFNLVTNLRGFSTAEGELGRQPLYVLVDDTHHRAAVIKTVSSQKSGTDSEFWWQETRLELPAWDGPTTHWRLLVVLRQFANQPSLRFAIAAP